MYIRLELGDKDKFESTGEVIKFKTPKLAARFLKEVAEKLETYNTVEQYVQDESFIIKND
jgi:hypothetical protein